MSEFQKRLVSPMGITLGALAIIAIIVFNVSRILLYLEHQGSPTAATVGSIGMALAVFVAVMAMAGRGAGAPSGLAVLLGAGVLLVGGGTFSYANLPGEEEGEHEEVVEPGPAGGAVELVAQDVKFLKTELTAPAGPVEITLKNEGAATHDFTLEGVAAFTPIKVTGGSSGTGTFDAEPGEYTYFCSQPGHRTVGMEGVLTITEGGGAAAGAGGGAIDIEAADVKFLKTALTAPAGEVKITFKNTGAATHDFTIEGQPAFTPIKLAGGETGTGTFDAKPGEYTYFCSQPGHRTVGMEGVLTITEGGGAAAGAGGGAVDIEAADVKFLKTALTAPAGAVKITFKNTGAALHDFTIEGQPAFKPIKVPGGETGTGTFDAKPGEYTYFCSQPGHRTVGMEGILTITEAGGGAAGGGGGGGGVDLVAQDVKFLSTELSAPAGAVKITFKNEGAALHDFTIEGQPAFKPIKVPGGETGTGTFDAKPGEYTYFCSQPGHRTVGMEGILTIK